MNIAKKIAQLLSIRTEQSTAVLQLLADGSTVPFIARYRKEATDSLDEEQIRQIADLAEKIKALTDRRETIRTAIAEQGKLTPELTAQIAAAETMTALEDLYQPYKKKRRTRAMIARERGLEPLAELILSQLRSRQTTRQIAAPFCNDDVPTPEDALAGARDIVAEVINDDAEVRGFLREKGLRYGRLQAKKIPKADDPRAVYKLYYDFDQQVDRVRPHQTLAINRGEEEKILRVNVDIPERDWILAIRRAYRADRRSPLAEQLGLAGEDAAKRLLLPAIDRDVRRHLTEIAENHAIEVFAQNLRGLLQQPPLAGHNVLAIDPAYRTGCKLAVLDDTGGVRETGAIYPHPPQNKREAALKTLRKLVEKYQVTLITIGNGTASRETEQLVAELTRETPGVSYLMTNEAGASVYSASPLARAELPELDVTLRGAVSIGRRVQDPLAELVKIDPKAIGVGLYQHDVNQKALSTALDAVVESVVNRVGVDLNTASPALLTHISGIGPKLAERIVAYREEHGRFPTRTALKKVSGLGPKAFEQSAGFLRISGGREPLDAGAIHPESYPAARALLKRARLQPDSPLAQRERRLQGIPLTPQLAAELRIGLPTLQDIHEQLLRPGRDPREELPRPILRSDVLSMEDLREGMQLKGTVRNVVDFGAFIDIGVKQDGLLHRSKIPRGRQLQVGDVLTVTILSIDKDRGRIGFGWVTDE
jgi:uncharacterized protein